MNAPPEFSTLATHISCFGSMDGSIDLTLTGGTPPFAFDWSNGDTVEDPINLCAGDYTIIVTDNNGCTKTSSATITQPNVLTVAISDQTNLKSDIKLYGG